MSRFYVAPSEYETWSDEEKGAWIKHQDLLFEYGGAKGVYKQQQSLLRGIKTANELSRCAEFDSRGANGATIKHESQIETTKNKVKARTAARKFGIPENQIEY